MTLSQWCILRPRCRRVPFVATHQSFPAHNVICCSCVLKNAQSPFGQVILRHAAVGHMPQDHLRRPRAASNQLHGDQAARASTNVAPFVSDQKNLNALVAALCCSADVDVRKDCGLPTLRFVQAKWTLSNHHQCGPLFPDASLQAGQKHSLGTTWCQSASRILRMKGIAWS